MDYPQLIPSASRPWADLTPRRYSEPASSVQADKGDTISLGQLLQPLRRYRGTILLCALGGGLLAVLAAIPQKPVYEARAELEIQDYNDNFLNMRDMDPSSRDHATDTYLQTQMRLLQGDALLEKVADRLHLQPPAAEGPGVFTRLLRTVHLLPQPRPGKQAFLRDIARRLTIRPVGTTRIVEVIYASEDPQLAANFANTLADEFITESLDRRVRSTQQTSKWLAGQLGDLKSNLERSEQQLQAYAREAGLLFTSDKDSIADAKLRQLQEALSKAQDERIVAEAVYNRTSASPADSLPEVQNDLTLRSYQERLAELNRELAQLSATYTQNYYKVKEVKAQIASLEAALDKGRGYILKRIRNQYESAVNREKMLTDLYSRQASLVAVQSGQSVRYNMLKGEVDANRQLYESMLQKVKEAGIASGIRASNVQVVDPARPPQFPARPNVPLYAGAGLFSGAVFGIGYVFARKRNDFVIQAPGDITLHLRFPELGAIPDAAREIGGSRMPRLLKRGDLESEPSPLEMVSWHRKESPMAESFRAALASVLFSGPKGEWPRAIVITSSVPGEGKTVVAANFAIALAETNHRVLLVDGDLRRPRLHTVFGIPNERGLGTLLRDATPPKSYPAEVLGEKTEVPGLYVLPSGPDAGGAANLLYSPRAAELFQRLRREFHAIVIDTPPLVIADARGLARLADGVALVVRADHTSPEMAAASLRRLSEDGTWVLGTVLNSWDTRKTSGYQPYTQYTS